MKKYVVAVTGASGPVVGLRVIKELAKTAEVYLVLSEQSFSILRHETGIDWNGKSEEEVQRKIRRHFKSKKIFAYHEKNFYAPIASGSFKTDGMFIVPCSMKSLAGIASGYSNSLIERAADVAIKEGRPLIISPREIPFSPIHLENMLKLSRIGVKIVPPVLGFYHAPESIDDLVDFAAGKILDVMGVSHHIFKRWGS